MPVEMTIPFALGPDGNVSLAVEDYPRAKQRVQALVTTKPTERVMDTRFGVPLERFLFESDDASIQVELRSTVADVVARYEPGVAIGSVSPVVVSDSDPGTVTAQVLFTLTEDPHSGGGRFANTAVITPAGTVTETLRG